MSSKKKKNSEILQMFDLIESVIENDVKRCKVLLGKGVLSLFECEELFVVEQNTIGTSIFTVFFIFLKYSKII